MYQFTTMIEQKNFREIEERLSTSGGICQREKEFELEKQNNLKSRRS